ncbi:MAG: putative Ig domain-containing protein [Blastocatellales bacterium]
MAFQPEGRLSLAAVQSQRRAIAQTQTGLLARLTAFQIRSVKRFTYIPFIAMEVDAGALAQLREAPEVTSIVEDALQEFSLAESVPLIGAPAAWAAGYSGTGQVVAVVDTGVAKTHPFLADKVVSEACFSTSNSVTTSLCPAGAASSTAPDSGVNCDPTLPGCEHGTHVAGIAAGKGDTFSGVARDAKIIAIKVASKLQTCPPSPTPCVAPYISDTLLGLQRVYELRNDFSIASVNLSLGGGSPVINCDDSETAYKAIIDNLRSVGIATVVASGNDGAQNGISRPACISSAVSVGSSADGSNGSSLNAVSSFSNSATSLNLLAPGEWINSSVPGGGFANFRGTSMATPHVAGAFALLKSKTPNASVSQVLQALSATGLQLTDSRNNIAKPRIKVDDAVTALSSSPCNYSISIAMQSFSANGGSGSVNVTAGSGCTWSAASNVPWMSITSGSSGSANGSVDFTVAANSGFERKGTLTIAGNTFTVTQSGLAMLAVDDGSFENAVGLSGGGTLTALNRLTPSSYPATIDAVGIYFKSLMSVSKGTSVTIVYGVNPTGNSDVNSVIFQTVNSTIQNLDEFNIYQIPKISIASGDFVVGFRITHPSGRLPVVIDQTPSSNRRSYLSTGATYTLVDDISSSLAGNFGIRAILAQKAAITSDPVITAESCATANQAVDPGESVTVDLGLRNSGLDPLNNLVATLLPTGGVTNPGPPQSFGTLAVGSGSASRPFTFTASGNCGGEITATLQLQDGPTDLGTVTYKFLLGASSAYTVTSNYTYTGSSVSIPDRGLIEIPINVSDNGVISDVNVRLRANHPWVSDLDIYLVGPDGTTVELTTDNGASEDNYGSGLNNCSGVFTVFDDSAATPITSGAPPFEGIFRPEGLLSAFNGKPAAGVWKLRVFDDESLITGSLGCWQLEISRQQIVCCGSTCPILTGVNPVLSSIGTIINLTGLNFTGVSGVKFSNNINANFNVVSPTQISTTVPSGAMSGPVTVSKTGCLDFQANFKVITCATVSGISPSNGLVNSKVKITGTNFDDVTAVQFANNIAAQYTIDSPTQITVTVPSGALSGPIRISKTGCSDILTAAFTVCAPITLTPGSIAAGSVGAVYNQAITAGGGTAPYTYSIGSGTLPNGLSLSSNGTLSGTPARSGNFNFTVSATDANGCTGSLAYTLAINCTSTITLSPATLPNGTAGLAYNQPLTAGGGLTPYSFVVTSGALPTGLTLTSAGALSGIPGASGTFNFTVTATDNAGCTGSQAYSFVIAEAGSNCLTPPSGMIGWWPGDGNSNDIKGTNNGILRNGANANGTGKVGKAFSLDGFDDYIEIPDSPSLRPTSLTVDAWVKFDALETPGALQPGLQYIVFRKNSRDSEFEGFTLNKMRVNGSDRLCFGVTSAYGTQVFACSLDLVSIGTFYHVAGTYDGNTVKFYLNGTLQDQKSSGFPIDYGSRPIFIGSTGEPVNDGKFQGIIDEVEIFSRALTDTEIRAIFNADSAGKCKTTLSCPTFSSMSATGGTFGSTVTITGTNLTGVTAVRFAGNITAQFTVNSATQVTATVPSGAMSGPITISKTGCPDVQTGSFTIVCPSISITPATIPAGTRNTAYNQSFSAAGGAAPYNWSLSAGTLPQGLTLSPVGQLSGTPTQNGNFNFTVRATDANNCTGTLPYALTINIDCQTITLNPATLPGGTAGTGYNQALTANGGTAPYSFSVTAGSLPGGLTLTSGGTLSGTPTSAGAFNFTVTAADANGCTGARSYTVNITCPTITLNPVTLPGGTAGTGYNHALTAGGGTAPYSFSVTAGSLPGGLTLTSGGTLSGTPTSAGAFNFTVTAADANGCTGTRSYTVNIQPACPAVTSISPTSGASGASVTINGSGFTGVTAVTFANNAAAQFTVVSDSQIDATVPVNAVTGPITVSRSGCPDVQTPAFTVIVPNPQPVITGLAPTILPAGSAAFTLVVTGTGFVNGAVVRWNGADRQTNYVSATSLTAQIAASDLGVPGTATVAVFNPEPGGGTSNQITFIIANPVTNVSAASFAGGMFAPESIVAAFGNRLATGVEVAQTIPLPTNLGGTSLKIRDSLGAERLSPIFFVSPTQINYLIPAGTMPGDAIVTVTSGDGSISIEKMLISAVSPALFSADASGQGVATGSILRVKPDGTQILEPVAVFDPSIQKFVPVPVDLSNQSDRVFLILYGSGIRHRNSLSSVAVTIGGLDMPALYAGPTPGFEGLDQLNIELMQTLIGRGEIEVMLTVDGITANKVKLTVK